MQGGLNLTDRRRGGFAPHPREAEARRDETGAYVIAATALGETLVTGHGDGTLRLYSGEADARILDAHTGAVLAMAREGERAVVTGGDDGRFLRVSADGTVEELAEFGAKWVDCVASHERAGLRACSVGKTVHLWHRDSDRTESFSHPSTVGGIAFDPKGRRLAVAHYGGVTLWERGPRRWKSSKLAWAGSHIGVTWSPDGKYVVSVMQENAMHGWRLRDKTDMRMAGYPAKPRVFDWVGDGPHLVTSGADSAVCWPFSGKTGPMGGAPLLVANGGRQIASCVCGVPGRPGVVAGFRDGEVLLSALEEDTLPHVVSGSTGIEASALAVTPSLSHLLIGDVDGTVIRTALDSVPRDGVGAPTFGEVRA